MRWLDKWRRSYFVLLEAEVEYSDKRYKAQLEKLYKKRKECSHILSDRTSAFRIKGWNGHKDTYTCQICGTERSGLY